MTSKTCNVAVGQKTWIVVVARTGRPMTNEMTLRAAQAWAQSRNGLVGETMYICRSTV